MPLLWPNGEMKVSTCRKEGKKGEILETSGKHDK